MRPLLLVLLTAAVVWALSPDLLATQWRNEGLGQVCDACISNDGLIVWAAGGVAGLDSNGRIKWRRSATCPIARAPGTCVTLHLHEDRLYQATNGVVEWFMPEARPVQTAAPLEGGGWVLHSRAELWALSAKGVATWAQRLVAGESLLLLRSSSDAAVQLVTHVPPHEIVTATIDLKAGAARTHDTRHSMQSKGSLLSVAVLAPGTLVALDSLGALHYAPLNTAGAMEISPEKVEGDLTRLLGSAPSSEGVLVGSTRFRRVSLSASHRSLLVGELQDGAAALGDGAAFYFAAASNSSLWLELRSSSSTAYQGPAMQLPLRRLLPLRSTSASPQLLVQRADLRLDLFVTSSSAADSSTAQQRLRRQWTREEALAEVKDALFIDLAAPPHSHVLDLFASTLPALQEETKGLRQDEYRDRGGLRKQAILLTAVHTLHSLATDGGAQLWRTPLPLSAQQPAVWSRVLHSKSASVLVAVVALPDATLLAAIAPFTGALLHSELLPGRARHAASAHGTVYVVDAQGAAFAYPRTPMPLDDDLAQQLYFVEHDSRTVRAYALVGSKGHRWRAEERWQYAAATGESIVQVVFADEGDLSASSVRIRSNGSVLHKSRNALNSILVLLFNSSASSLHSLLLHAPTGATLHSHVYRGVAEPISALKSEHWHAILFWDPRAHRQAVYITEVFARPSPSSTHTGAAAWFVAWLLGTPADGTAQTTEAARPDALQVLSQSYYLAPGSHSTVHALGVTHSHSGVAGKLLVLGAASGQLFGLDKRLLDVRRVPREKWTTHEQEEGVLPYNATVALASQAALFARPVTALRFVRSAAARLESTTHVLAVGADLAYTHVCPAGPFDRLSPDFNRLALVVTLSGLSLVTILLSLCKRTPSASK